MSSFILFYIFVAAAAYLAANGLFLYERHSKHQDHYLHIKQHISYAIAGLAIASLFSLFPRLLPNDLRFFSIFGGTLLLWLIITHIIVLIIPPHEFTYALEAKKVTLPFTTQSPLWPNTLIPTIVLLDYKLLSILNPTMFAIRLITFILTYLALGAIVHWLMYKYNFKFNRKFSYLASVFLSIVALLLLTDLYS